MRARNFKGRERRDLDHSLNEGLGKKGQEQGIFKVLREMAAVSVVEREMDKGGKQEERW